MQCSKLPHPQFVAGLENKQLQGSYAALPPARHNVAIFYIFLKRGGLLWPGWPVLRTNRGGAVFASLHECTQNHTSD